MDLKGMPMMNLDEVEKAITLLRAQATQLNVTADALETWITPWRNAQKFVEDSQKVMQQFWPPWMKP